MCACAQSCQISSRPHGLQPSPTRGNGGRNPPWGAPGPSRGRRFGATFIFYRLLRGSKKLTPIRERQAGRERQSRKKTYEISRPQPRGGRGAGVAARGRGRSALAFRAAPPGACPRRSQPAAPRGDSGALFARTPRAAQRPRGLARPRRDLHALQSQRFKVRSAGRPSPARPRRYSSPLAAGIPRCPRPGRPCA